MIREPRPIVRLCLLLLAAVPAALPGCASAPRREQPARAPEPAREPAAGGARSNEPPVDPTEPVQLTMNVGQPLLDTDGNGFPDSMEVWVYLFPSPRRSEMPVWSDGSFEFRLRGEHGDLLGAWDVPAERSHAFRQRFSPGPGYVFGLSLVEGEDVMSRRPASLFLTFVTPSGRRITSKGPATLTLGAN